MAPGFRISQAHIIPWMAGLGSTQARSPPLRAHLSEDTLGLLGTGWGRPEGGAVITRENTAGRNVDS